MLAVAVKHKEKVWEASEERDNAKVRWCTIRQLCCINLTGEGIKAQIGWMVG